MRIGAIGVWLSAGITACGARSEPSGGWGFYGSGGVAGLPSVGSDGGGDGAVVASGGTGAGGRGLLASGGRSATGGVGTGGLGTGGFVLGAGGAGGAPLGSGGSVPATGGRPQPAPEDARLVPFICRDLCRPGDCPSALPYVGDCNGISHTCLIICDRGCPPGTQSLSVAGGCFCYDPRVHAVPQNNGNCCSSYCGAPYYLPCCSGYACARDGRCCLGSTCL